MNKMNKEDFIRQFAKELDISLDKSKDIYDTFVKVLAESVSEHKDVRLAGFGIFKHKKRKARVGRNPRTGEPLNIAEKTSLGFTPWRNFFSL